MSSRWILDPNDKLQYKIDYAALENGRGESNWLDRTSSPLEYIVSHTVTNVDSPGLTILSSTVTDSNTSITIKLTGGTVGTKYRLLCHIVTNVQEKDDTVIVRVISR